MVLAFSVLFGTSMTMKASPEEGLIGFITGAIPPALGIVASSALKKNGMPRINADLAGFGISFLGALVFLLLSASNERHYGYRPGDDLCAGITLGNGAGAICSAMFGLLLMATGEDFYKAHPIYVVPAYRYHY